jgi:hypothetical protein
MAGYSGTPLARKLGIKDGFRVWFVNAPHDFGNDLDLPADIQVISTRSKPLDLVLLFTNQSEVAQRVYGGEKALSHRMWSVGRKPLGDD